MPLTWILVYAISVRLNMEKFIKMFFIQVNECIVEWVKKGSNTTVNKKTEKTEPNKYILYWLLIHFHFVHGQNLYIHIRWLYVWACVRYSMMIVFFSTRCFSLHLLQTTIRMVKNNKKKKKKKQTSTHLIYTKAWNWTQNKRLN